MSWTGLLSFCNFLVFAFYETRHVISNTQISSIVKEGSSCCIRVMRAMISTLVCSLLSCSPPRAMCDVCDRQFFFFFAELPLESFSSVCRCDFCVWPSPEGFLPSCADLFCCSTVRTFFLSTAMMMLSRASLAAVERVSRVHVYRTFTSTTPLGDQYDVVVIGAFFLFSIVARHLLLLFVRSFVRQ